MRSSENRFLNHLVWKLTVKASVSNKYTNGFPDVKLRVHSQCEGCLSGGREQLRELPGAPNNQFFMVVSIG